MTTTNKKHIVITRKELFALIENQNFGYGGKWKIQDFHHIYLPETSECAIEFVATETPETKEN